MFYLGPKLENEAGTDAFEAGGGGGGATSLYIQQTRPLAAGPWQWYQTDAAGNLIDLVINDGSA